MICSLVGLAFLASCYLVHPAFAQETGLPDSPSRLTLAELAELTAGNALGSVVESKTAIDGVEYPTQLKVCYSRYGSLSHDEIVNFSWDSNHPPLQLGSAAEHGRDSTPLCLFAKDRRLLCVAYERHDWVISTVGMARLPSTRFSARELELAWLAKQSDREGRWAVSFGQNPFYLAFCASSLRYFDFSPGHVELSFRFGPSKEHYLRSFSDRRELRPSDVENIRWCTWDPCAEHDALHALLDNRLEVSSSPFVAESTRFCARVAQGDKAARETVLLDLARLERLLTWKPAESHTAEELHEHRALAHALGNSQVQADLIETAAYGSKEALPTLREIVRKRARHSDFAWLRLGGSTNELLALVGGNPLMLSRSDLARAGTLDALRLLLMRITAMRKGEFVPLLQDDLIAVYRLVGMLRPESAHPVLEMVRRTLREVPRPERQDTETYEDDAEDWRILVLTLLHAGDDAALDDLAQLELPSTSDIVRFTLELADVPGLRAIAFQTRLLSAALRGYPHDCTLQSPRDVSVLAAALHRRGVADRALALELLSAEPSNRGFIRGQRVLVRWALGEMPTVPQLREMEMREVILSCGLSLESEGARYAELLPELRSDPRKYWLQLALLRDETSLPELGEWLQQSIEAGQPYFEPLCAMRLMASPDAARYFTGLRPDSIPELANDYISVLGSIESPANLPSVARRGLAAKDPTEQLAWLEFLILLGRRD